MRPRFTHVRLLVDDYRAAFVFYRDVLELDVVWGDESSGYADLRAGGEVQVAIFEREGMGALASTPVAGDQVALIFAVDDVDAFVARARQRSATLVAAPQDRPDWGIRTAHLRDPASTLIEINSPLPRADWSEQLIDADERYSES